MESIILNIKNENIFVFNVTKFVKNFTREYKETNMDNIDDDIANWTTFQSYLVREVVKELLRKGIEVEDYEWKMHEKDLEEIKQIRGEKMNTNQKREKIAEEIVDDIISQRAGQTYDEEILYEFVTLYFENEMEKIRNIVDEKMYEHLEEDNLTIKE